MFKIKKVIATLLVVVMMASIGTNVLAQDVEGADALETLRANMLKKYTATYEVDAVNKVVDRFTNAELFYQHYAVDPAGALANVEGNVEMSIRDATMPYWYADGLYAASAPVIRQYKDYTCGPTSGLQVLTGLGYANRIAGSTDNQKQDTLERDMGTAGTTIVYQVTNGINKYSDVPYKYSQILTIEQFQSEIAASLYMDRPVILNAMTGSLGYYNTHNTGHYIVLKGYNARTNKVVLADCNYNYQYCGIFARCLQYCIGSRDRGSKVYYSWLKEFCYYRVVLFFF